MPTASGQPSPRRGCVRQLPYAHLVLADLLSTGPTQTSKVSLRTGDYQASNVPVRKNVTPVRQLFFIVVDLMKKNNNLATI